MLSIIIVIIPSPELHLLSINVIPSPELHLSSIIIIPCPELHLLSIIIVIIPCPELHPGPLQAAGVRQHPTAGQRAALLHHDPPRGRDVWGTLHPLPGVPQRPRAPPQGKAGQQTAARFRHLRPQNSDFR